MVRTLYFVSSSTISRETKLTVYNMQPNHEEIADSNEQVEVDDEPDEWDQRILETGCYKENLALQLCHADKGDWRACLGEMQAFKKCWDEHLNNERTQTVDN